MRKMKPTIKYYFSVEGETEKWYRGTKTLKPL